VAPQPEIAKARSIDTFDAVCLVVQWKPLPAEALNNMHMRFDAVSMREDRREHPPWLSGGRRNIRIDSDVGPELAAVFFELGPALTCTVCEHGFGPKAIVPAHAATNTGVRVT
jgi:hypothetical protein